MVAGVLATYPILLRYLETEQIALIIGSAIALGVLLSGRTRRIARGAVRALGGMVGKLTAREPAQDVAPGLVAIGPVRLLRRFTADATGFDVRVRGDAPLRADALMRARFRELNAIREARGLVPYYDAVRFLPVGLPEWSPDEQKLVIEAVPIDYAVAALVIDPAAADDARRAGLELLHRVSGVQPYLRPHWAEGKMGLLGVQVCLVTADRRLLLRRRGDSVLFASGRWDVSVSGFAGSVDVVDGWHVDVTRTVEHETYREIGHLRADPRTIRLLGVTHNWATGAYDVLACWVLEAETQDLLALLVRRRERGDRVFDTELRAIERYVWDTKNLIVNLDRHDVSAAWRECGVAPADFEPQSLLCIDLTLDLLTAAKDPRFLPAM
jgi:hypothetical protein